MYDSTGPSIWNDQTSPLSCPSRILVGKDSDVVTVLDYTKLSSMLGSQLEVVASPDAGGKASHFFVQEQPNLISDKIEEALDATVNGKL